MDDFGKSIAYQSVGKVCLSLGIKSTYDSVLCLLADILEKYVKILAKHAKNRSEIGGYNNIKIEDILISLEECGTPFRTNWKILSKFGWKDITRPNASDARLWFAPFPYAIPSFPVQKKKRYGNIKNKTKLIENNDLYNDRNNNHLNNEEEEKEYEDSKQLIKDIQHYLPDNFPPLPTIHIFNHSQHLKKSYEPKELSIDEKRAFKLENQKKSQEALIRLNKRKRNDQQHQYFGELNNINNNNNNENENNNNDILPIRDVSIDRNISSTLPKTIASAMPTNEMKEKEEEGNYKSKLQKVAEGTAMEFEA